ncbi:MAG: ribosomal RNA small subunit methyltransferase A [Verrucomicrobia bacterium]|nr:ribosomal RNA small subunit methyltransferase A [Verrucomicrobiota bacterium]MBS0646088.1 ribosomal RNA small subunit methyltransferase A [Verrucomicrobiota bacterium]
MLLTQQSVLKAFLQEAGLEAKKGFSQNFLVEDSVVKSMLQVADVQPTDVVLEIGPGPGAVTQQLLQKGAEVVAVEKDPRFAALLPRLPGKLKVMTQDVLDFDLSLLHSFKVVASLPYHLTSEILQRILPHPGLQSLTVLVQKEAALRFLADQGTKAYNVFSLFLRYYGHIQYVKTVHRQCFYPKPRVDSAIVHFVPHAHPSVEASKFQKVISLAFSKRRKMLRQIFDETILVQAGLDPTLRPEKLCFEEFVRLTAAWNA